MMEPLHGMTKKYITASAPGRLDVMGGIADYSGSLVLQMPIAQRTTVTLLLREDYQCNLTSQLSSGETLTAHVDYRDYLSRREVDYQFAQEKFKQNPHTAWIAYVLGCALVLQKENGIDFRGADFTAQSQVPLGKGVSSSASIEVACMKALAEAFQIEFSGTTLPTLAQRVENLIVGAPCGLMDQLACYLGEPKKLLPIHCQPDQVEESIPLPVDISFIGIDSGIRHSVAGASYGDVRCAAFMGYTIVANLFGSTQEELRLAKASNNFFSLPFRGFLCNISVEQFEESIAHKLPHALSGKDFIEEYGFSIDHVTIIDKQRNYQIRTCASHPVYENDRVKRFMEYLVSLNQPASSRSRNAILKSMGQLMYQSHESYSRCGLGSQRTDEIVTLAKSERGIYGAKITGGGNGGTVCLLVDEEGKKSAHKIHQLICEKYGEELMLFEG
jgi:galactokinase